MLSVGENPSSKKKAEADAAAANANDDNKSDKDYFNKFEMVRVNASIVQFKGEKAISLSFFSISEHKAQN